MSTTQRKISSKPRKGDTVRIKWSDSIPETMRGKKGIVVVNNTRDPYPYYLDNDDIQEGDPYWGPFKADDLVVQ
jgi:hypothetical protein